MTEIILEPNDQLSLITAGANRSSLSCEPDQKSSESLREGGSCGLVERIRSRLSPAVRAVRLFVYIHSPVASWQPFGKEEFIPFLGPQSRQAWNEIEKIWAGKTSLMQVVRDELKKRE